MKRSLGRNADLVERSLLYVALTRAKKTATVTGWGTLSPLIGVQG
jgi:ATP-dependent exoDNAse (exonuclease V) alpha subunit